MSLKFISQTILIIALILRKDLCARHTDVVHETQYSIVCAAVHVRVRDLLQVEQGRG